MSWKIHRLTLEVVWSMIDASLEARLERVRPTQLHFEYNIMGRCGLDNPFHIGYSLLP